MASPGNRKQYPTDMSDEEWAFAAPYLTLMGAMGAPHGRLARMPRCGAEYYILGHHGRSVEIHGQPHHLHR